MKDARLSLVGSLIEHYEMLVSHLRWRFDDRDSARDIVHDAYLKLLSSPPQQPVLQPAAFARRVATHLAIDHHRIEAGRRRLLPIDPEADVEQVAVAGPEAEIERQQTLRMLRDAIDALPPRCRDVFVLHKLHDVPQREIAERLGISQGMVAKHMMRAMQSLRPLIDAEDRKGLAP